MELKDLLLENKKTIYILHSFNGRPYFEAVEYFAKKDNMKLEYIETNWFKSLIKTLLGRKCINCNLKDVIKNFLFFSKVPLIKNQIIIYGTAPYDFRFLWYSLLSKRNNFIYHTSYYKWENDKEAVFYYKGINNILKKIWINKLMKQKIVCVTKAVENSIKRIIKNNNKIFQIYHSINFNKFYKKRNFENESKLKILFVGRMVYEKGLDTIAELIKVLDKEKFEFTFVGDGKYRKNIEYIFNEENVNYLGWISDKNKLAKIFKEHHILLNPSIKIKGWEELFGIVNIEAMAAGMIVIASNHIGPREIIKSGKNGFLIEEKNIKQIKNIICNLFENKKKMNLISQEAIDFAKKFDINNISKKWKEAINA